MSDKVKKDNKVRNAVIIAVIGTLVVVTAFAVVFALGVRYEQGRQDQVQSAVKAAVQAK